MWKLLKFNNHCIIDKVYNFCNFFFLSKFSFTNIYDSQDSKEMGGNPLISLYHSHPLHKHLNISWAITAGLEPGTFGFQTQVANH